jgi:hypothetical protein
MLYKFAKSTLLKTYCAGVLCNAILCLREENIDLNKRIKDGKNPDMFTYGITSFVGLTTGGFIGLFWPITVLGRLVSIPILDNSPDKNK